MDLRVLSTKLIHYRLIEVDPHRGRVYFITTPHFREPANLLVVLGQRNLVQGRDDLFAQQLDRAHDRLRVHGPLIPVDVQVAGVEALDHLGQLPDDRLRRADNDIIDRLELLVGHPDPQTTGPLDVARGTLRLHADGFARLVAGRVVVLSWAPLAVANRPHELVPELDGLLIGIRHQAAQEIPEVLRPRREADVRGGIDIHLPQPLRGVDQGAQV